MPARDNCQPEIIRALEKDGWTVIHNPPAIYETRDMPAFIDLYATKNHQPIFIEVKCFPRAKRSQELHIAFGQYVIYRELLARLRPDIILYLAVPRDNPDLTSPLLQAKIKTSRVKLIYVDLQKEVIFRWNE